MVRLKYGSGGDYGGLMIQSNITWNGGLASGKQLGQVFLSKAGEDDRWAGQETETAGVVQIWK